jgi:hypothetical protein
MRSQLWHYMKVSGQLHALATLPPGNHYTGGSVVPRACLNAATMKKIPSAVRN